MTAATLPRSRFTTTATYADIKQHINGLSEAMMPQPSEWSAHEDRHTLVVYCDSIADAIDWADAFGVPNERRTADNITDRDQRKRVFSGFVAWRGWHVQLHGADLLAEVA